MKVVAYGVLSLGLLMNHAQASPITVTITGVTGEIQVGEGPIFGHSSYQAIPPGAPFVLTCTFDDTRGKQTIGDVSDGVITESKTESAGSSSPGTNAVLQIGNAVWEFGQSTRSQLALKTAKGKSEQLTYSQNGGNKVAADISPGKAGFWPRSADWRASFVSTSLEGSTATFSADNDRVSARGRLFPETITVSGVDLDGQWLRAETSPDGQAQWRLAHASPRGGYIVAEMTQTIRGRFPDGSAVTPPFVRSWQAWRVAAGADAPASAAFLPSHLKGATGEENVAVTARFYEEMTLPLSFAADTAGRLVSTTDPQMPTSNSTLPVAQSFEHSF